MMKEKAKYDMTAEERIEKATKLKDEGTNEFTSGNHKAAADMYMTAAEVVNTSRYMSHSSEEDDVYVKCLNNAAACYVKEGDWAEVIKCCNNAIEKKPDEAKTNIKLLYRRGLAKMHTGELKQAKADLMAAYAIDKNDNNVRKAIAQLKEKNADSKEKEKMQFGNFFGKVDMYDDKEVVPKEWTPDSKVKEREEQKRDLPWNNTQDYLESLRVCNEA